VLSVCGALASRAHVLLPHLTAGDVATIDAIVREALEPLSEAGDTPLREAADAERDDFTQRQEDARDVLMIDVRREGQ
jgi:hypothetical protein